jgi:UDP-N-acetyl-2-amino-2-deoxyglucuronate dehydrogenase
VRRRASRGVEIAAVYGENRSRAARLGQAFGARAYRELEDFLDHPGLDAVLIGSPSGLHAEQAMSAAGRGLHVLVEKPLDIATDRVDRLIDVVDDADVKVGVFFQERTESTVQWLRRLISSGQLGAPILASAHVKWYRPPEYYASSRWRGTWALDGGGALMNQGIHTVDLLLWLLGDVQDLYARTTTALHDIEVEDTAVACLTFEGGAVGTLEVSTSAYPGFARRLEVTGTEGTVVLEGERVVVCELRTAPDEPAPDVSTNGRPSAPSAKVSDIAGHRRVIEDFVRAIETDGPVLCDARDGRRSVEVIEAIYRSARLSAAVQLRPRAETGENPPRE